MDYQTILDNWKADIDRICKEYGESKGNSKVIGYVKLYDDEEEC